MKRVFATIVTFRRPEILSNCIESLLNQRQFGLERIHVVVNSKDQETIDLLNKFSSDSAFITYELLDNPGPAGGFNCGLRRFLEYGGEYVWLMDDDIVAEADCLKELLKHTDKHQYIFPRVIKGNGEDVVSFGWWGVLLSRDLVLEAGLPIEELFFWTEDTEYLQYRLIRKCKVNPFRSRSGIVRHLHLRKKKYPSWYYYYAIRNTLYYRGYIVGYNFRRFRRTIYLYIHSFAMILMKEDNKLKKLKLVVYGTYHGLTGRIGKLVDPELNK